MTNFPLNSNDEVFDIIKRPPEQDSIKVLPLYKQRIFTELHRLSGEAYQERLKEASEIDCEKIKKVDWVMKTKLTND